MTVTEKQQYIEDQKNCGIEVGDKVRATQHFRKNEGGCHAICSTEGRSKTKFIDDKAIGTVDSICTDYIVVDCGNEYWNVWNFPYFVLQIVKKKDGSVPSNETVITGELSMSTTNFECKAVLVENGGDGAEKKTVLVFKNDLFEVDETEAKRRFSMDFASAIKEAEKKGKVEILCRPFCG